MDKPWLDHLGNMIQTVGDGGSVILSNRASRIQCPPSVTKAWRPGPAAAATGSGSLALIKSALWSSRGLLLRDPPRVPPFGPPESVFVRARCAICGGRIDAESRGI